MGEQCFMALRALNQFELEDTYLKSNAGQIVKDYIPSDIFGRMYQAIVEYRNKTYKYNSKNVRVSNITDSNWDIAEALITLILLCDKRITPIQALCSQLAPLLNKELIPGIKTASEIIAVCEGSAYDILHSDYEFNPTGTLAIEPILTLPSQPLRELEELMYLPPMVQKPVWKGNSNGGLLTKQQTCLLGTQSYHDEHLDLESLNLLQSIKWRLNPNVLSLEEKPNKALDTAEKALQFSKLKKQSRDLYDMYKDQEFYFLWKYDKRGRSYNQGYHISLQSIEYKKAVLEFADKETITL